MNEKYLNMGENVEIQHERKQQLAACVSNLSEECQPYSNNNNNRDNKHRCMLGICKSSRRTLSH